MSICFFRPRRRSVNIQTTELFFSVFVGTVGVSWRAWLLIYIHYHAYSGNISNRIKTVNSCRPLFLKNYHYIPLAIILWRVSSPKHDTCCVMPDGSSMEYIKLSYSSETGSTCQRWTYMRHLRTYRDAPTHPHDLSSACAGISLMSCISWVSWNVFRKKNKTKTKYLKMLISACWLTCNRLVCSRV